LSTEQLPGAATEAGQRKFPCGSCGALLVFDPSVAELKCPYCQHVTPIPQTEADIQELDYAAILEQTAGESTVLDHHAVKCPVCGAETALDKNIAYGLCPFCNAQLKDDAAAKRSIQPAALLPFKVTKADALNKFRAWMSSLWFAPSGLQAYARADDRLHGLYTPYWTYDADATSFYRGERGDDYWETETYTEVENGRTVTKTRQVRKTRWWPVSGTVYNDFNDVLVLASRSLPKDLTDKLEPWDLENLLPFKEDYLSGFRAECYSVSLPEGFVEARRIMDEAIRETVCKDIGGDHQRINVVKSQFADITFKHLLLPVWMSAFQYHDKTYRFVVNARTGEVQGERPYSFWKIFGAVTSAVVAIGALVFFLSRHH